MPLTLGDRAAGRRRVSPHASCPDQGVGGRSLSLPIIATAPTGTWRVRAYTDPKRPGRRRGPASWSRTTCRTAWSSSSASPTGKHLAATAPAEVTVDGRFLYGAPAAEPRPRRRGRDRGGRRSGRASRAISSARATTRTDHERRAAAGGPAADRRRRQGESSRWRSTRCRSTTRPLEAQHHRAYGGVRRPRGRAQADAADRRRRRR